MKLLRILKPALFPLILLKLLAYMSNKLVLKQMLKGTVAMSQTFVLLVQCQPSLNECDQIINSLYHSLNIV